MSADGWMPFTLPPSDARAGILAQPSFLSLHSHPGRSSPTLRGKALREIFLCQKVPDPPGNVNFKLVQDTSNPNYKTARQRLTAHRTSPTCAGCHKIMDPVGLAMENFDSIGGFRSTENGAAIDAGGDIVVRGSSSTDERWWVDIEDPADPSRTLATIAVSDAAVATSAGNRRRWRVGKGFAHHLIDPRTQSSSASDLVQSTVVAATAERADVLAKTAFTLGARDGRRFLERQPRVAAVLVHESGQSIFVGELDTREVPRA